MAIIDRAVYATQRSALQTQIGDLLKNAPSHTIEGEILAVIVPDTNQLEGGAAAAEIYKCLAGRAYDTVVLISPSHTGPFRRMTICSIDRYQTPLGELAVDDRLRNELCDEDDDIFLDDEGHFHTEGIDVQLPFLQMMLSGFNIVPIVMGEESPDFCRELGHAVGEIMYNRRALVVATADILSSTGDALEQFREYFEARDVSHLMSLMNGGMVSIEGKGPLLVALIAAMHRRANKAQVLKLQAPEDDRPGILGAVLWR